VFTDATIDFIEYSVKKTDQPFFCALMYNAPHSPFLMDTSHYDQSKGDATITKYLDKGLPMREARLYALIDRVDQNLGRLLGKLDQLDIADNTLVVFTSDNGGVSKFWKGGMRGNKASAYEGGVRAPCFVRWPAKIEAGQQVDSQTSHVDWLPTFCEVAGIQPPVDRIIDGISLVRALEGNGKPTHHRYVYHTWDRYTPNPDRRWSISDDRWKLLCQVGTGRTAKRGNWRLFDLQSDPGESNNVAGDHPEHVRRLRKAFTDWFESVTAGRDYSPVPIPVAGPSVEIQPSWATWTGKHIAYTFDGYDWDTIDSWKVPGEKATWQLNVKQPGDYRVTLTYGCRPLDAGGTLVLSSGDPRLTHQVQATATADQFEPHDAGVIHLKAGRQTLTATVGDCPGDELMRLNGITLTPLDR
jgi:arylsulfatase A